MPASWIDSWPEDYHELLNAVARHLGLRGLYLVAEISGMSGARTFRANTVAPGGSGNPIVLKIGKKRLIANESKRFNKAANEFSHQPAMRNQVIEKAEWACIAMTVALDGRGQSLRTCFNGLEAKQIDTVLENLFEVATRFPKKNAIRMGCNPYALYNLQRQSLIRNLRAAGDSPYTLVDWWERAQKESERASESRFTHGDLHGGNVLVDRKQLAPGRGVSILDFGLSGEGHAYRDFAKLERDIWLFVDGVDPSKAGDRCDAIARALQPGAPVPVDESIKRAVRGSIGLRELASKYMGPANKQWEYEYRVALMAQFMFAAANPRVNLWKRRAALAQAQKLRDALVAEEPVLRVPVEEVLFRQREDRAWRFAYCFLRLDQLPKGAWSRTLPMWMEAIWEGEHGTVFRSPDMKDNGGVDSTGYAVSLLSQFWHRVFREGEDKDHRTLFLDSALRGMLRLNGVLDRCTGNLQDKVGDSGALAEGVTTRGRTPRVKLRHSLIGLLIHHRSERIAAVGLAQGVADKMADYLCSVLSRWKEDQTHLFGTYASAVALWERLATTPDAQSKPLRSELNKRLPVIAAALTDLWFRPDPEGTYPGANMLDGKIMASFFVPYYRLWRMERSNALMMLPLLVSEDGKRFTRKSDLKSTEWSRLSGELVAMLEEVDSQDGTTSGLVRYCDQMRDPKAPRDWGLSAELLGLIEMPAIADLLLTAGLSATDLDEKKRVLKQSLLKTLVDVSKHREVFKFSHGISCGAFLRSDVVDRICHEHVVELDQYIVRAMAHGSTEKALHELAMQIWTGKPADRDGEDWRRWDFETKQLTDLFVSKLASGKYTSDHWTQTSHAETIRFFDSAAGRLHDAHYRKNGSHDTLFTRLEDVSGHFGAEAKYALDLGCGAGVCARWLVEHGFRVHLVDDSTTMLDLAKRNLKDIGGGRCEFTKMDARKIDFKSETFDLVVANALMVHIAPMHAGDLFAKVRSILKPGGRFFVNFKLGDHTLQSLDDRYFAYYENRNTPEAMLRNAGFIIDEIALRWNDRTCYGVSKSIQWANFYCRRS